MVKNPKRENPAPKQQINPNRKNPVPEKNRINTGAMHALVSKRRDWNRDDRPENRTTKKTPGTLQSTQPRPGGNKHRKLWGTQNKNHQTNDCLTDECYARMQERGTGSESPLTAGFERKPMANTKKGPTQTNRKRNRPIDDPKAGSHPPQGPRSRNNRPGRETV